MNKVNFLSISKIFAICITFIYGALVLSFRLHDIVEINHEATIGAVAFIVLFLFGEKMRYIEVTLFNSFMISLLGLPLMLAFYDPSFLSILKGWGYLLPTLISTAILFISILLIRKIYLNIKLKNKHG
ncbi:hypothetical protein ACQ1Q5_00165 [Ornithobacterium rhinotracheale]